MQRRIGPDHVIAALAGAQAGRVSREQLLRQGIGAGAIDARVRTGRLHVDHRGVYSVGHAAATVEGPWWAALLACGEDALLSHATAAYGWELSTRKPELVEVCSSAHGRVVLRGVRAHRARRMLEHERTELRGMPITTPTRTVIDLAPRLSARRLEQLLDRGEASRILDLGDLRRALAEHRGRAGTPLLRQVLETYAPTVTRSELEEGFLELCDAHRIARPRLNTVVAGYEVDAYWPAAELVVELDGYAYHRSPEAFERDRARDIALAVAGLRVIRLTWRAVARDDAATAGAIRRLLASGPT
jgi:very-short-patch-repair endonuclease